VTKQTKREQAIPKQTATTCGECGTDDMTGRTGLMHDTSGRRCYRICGECRKWHEREGTYTG
jgi:hypothetical protein